MKQIFLLIILVVILIILINTNHKEHYLPDYSRPAVPFPYYAIPIDAPRKCKLYAGNLQKMVANWIITLEEANRLWLKNYKYNCL